MKKFIGTKTVMAEPMSKGEAYYAGLLQKGVSLSVPNMSEMGYKIQYEDGYTSWSPKDVFEKNYQLAETPLNRLEIECSDLYLKIKKLKEFCSTAVYEGLDSVMKAFLTSQLAVMEDYEHLLHTRATRMESGDGGIGGVGFGLAIQLLKAGIAVRRSGWNGKGLFVFKQVPAHIESDIIPKMQSLPDKAKQLILASKGFIDYTSQCLIYNPETGRADSWVPSISDVFAEDWEIVLDI